jgi:hypothetical protein
LHGQPPHANGAALLKQAREAALQHNTSVNALVRDFLER